MSDVSKIAVDWSALEAAFENHSPEVRSYLDRHSGELLSLVGGEADTARGVEVRENPERFLFVEPVPSREQYRIMERFIATVTYPALAERLSDAIVGKGAFRRFKDCIAQHVEERKRWFAFRDVLVHQFILDWCKMNRIEGEEEPGWSLELPPPPDPEVEQAEVVVDDEVRPETVELKRYLQAWARAHGEEYQYLFGPSAFDRLAEDLSQEFNLFRRR
ncbi:MAG: UPF0158 family protein [Pseudomonadota bacterium]